MKIAVEGCCHGELDAIYEHIAHLETQHSYKIDLLLICGDFQAIRNHQDLQCMSVPEKFRQLGGFNEYYTGAKAAPVLTLVIGGNHEASNYMWELFHGGWLAPNIFFVGNAGCVQVNGIRIAGMSGIFHRHHYRQGFYENMPYSSSTMRSIYHIREYNFRRLALLSKPHIFLSHDWPASIEHHGNLRDLLRRKPFFKDDVRNGALGSPPLFELLKALKPDWWFSAHLHVRFEATYLHAGVVPPNLPSNPVEKNPDEIVIGEDDDEPTPPVASPTDPKPPATNINPDEITLDDEEEDVAPAPVAPPPREKTNFLALDKCIPNSKRQFLEVVDIDSPETSSPPRLTFDPEWLAVVRAFDPYMVLTEKQHGSYPDHPAAIEAVSRELEWVKQNLPEGGRQDVNDVQTFVMTAAGPTPETQKDQRQQPDYFPNPQTAAFCSVLQIDNKVDRLNS